MYITCVKVTYRCSREPLAKGYAPFCGIFMLIFVKVSDKIAAERAALRHEDDTKCVSATVDVKPEENERWQNCSTRNVQP